MMEETVCVGVDVAKSTLDVAVTDSEEVRQFANGDKGISQAVSYIAGLKPAVIILEATIKHIRDRGGKVAQEPDSPDVA